jgi:hypothetical protein
MEEPAITLFVTETGEWRTADKWPLPETRWTPFYPHLDGLRIKCADDDQPANFLEAIAMGHLWWQSTSRVTVYHNEAYPSHLLLPVTRGNRIRKYMSGGKLSASFFPYRRY